MDIIYMENIIEGQIEFETGIIIILQAFVTVLRRNLKILDYMLAIK
jgi:hypothetical protein